MCLKSRPTHTKLHINRIYLAPCILWQFGSFAVVGWPFWRCRTAAQDVPCADAAAGVAAGRRLTVQAVKGRNKTENWEDD